MVEYSIREGSIDDLQRIAEGNNLLAEETEGLFLNRNDVLKGVFHLLTNPNLGFYIVAESDRMIVGQTLITFEWSDWRNVNIWWVQSVYVWPQYRRLGIFSSLFKAIKSKAKTYEIAEIRLYAEKDNLVAHETYFHLGFKSGHYKMFTQKLR